MDSVTAFFATVWNSLGLFYFIGFSICVVVYAFWPSNKKPFDTAARDILDGEDKPWH